MNITLNDLISPEVSPEVLGDGFGFTEGPAADARGTVYFSDGRNDSIHRREEGRPVALFVDDSTDANPDGMTLDEHDNLYVCCGKAGLKIFDPQGRPIGQIDVHAANCCFGGHDFRTLCIASAERFIGLRSKVAGLKPLPFRP